MYGSVVVPGAAENPFQHGDDDEHATRLIVPVESSQVDIEGKLRCVISTSVQPWLLRRPSARICSRSFNLGLISDARFRVECKGGGGGKGSEQQKDRKRGRGRNNKRPTDERPGQGKILCPHLSVGDPCVFGDRFVTRL